MAAIPLPVLSQMYFLASSPPFTMRTVRPACAATSTNRASAAEVEIVLGWRVGVDAVMAARSRAQHAVQVGRILPMQRPYILYVGRNIPGKLHRTSCPAGLPPISAYG